MCLMSLPGRVHNTVFLVKTLVGAGVLAPSRPDRLVAAVNAIVRFGITPAAGYTAAAARYPDDIAIIDDSGTLTFKEVNERSNAIAHALADDGVNEGDGVAIMARNHRGWVESVVACSKLGANALFLNTSFSGPQLTDVLRREKARALIYDEEFKDVLSEAGRRRRRYVAWQEPEGRRTDPTLDELVTRGDRSAVVAPAAE